MLIDRIILWIIVAAIVLLFLVVISLVIIENVDEILINQSLSINPLIQPGHNITIDCEYVMESEMQNQTVYDLCKETFPELYYEKEDYINNECFCL